MRRSVPSPQLWSGKFLPLRHKAERRIYSVLQSGAPHFFHITKQNAAFFLCITKRSIAFFLFYEAERRIFSILGNGALHFFRITKRKVLFAPILYHSAARITYRYVVNVYSFPLRNSGVPPRVHGAERCIFSRIRGRFYHWGQGV